MQDSIKFPGPGAFAEVSMGDYLRSEAVSASTLEAGIYATPRHVKAAADRDRVFKNTDATRVGTAVHLMVCEPHRKDELFEKAPGARWKATEEENPGKTVVPAGSIDKIEAMAKSIGLHPVVLDWFHDPSKVEREVCLFWIDDRTGLRCKARPDLWIPGSLIIDIKTTARIGYGAFSRTAESFGYHRKMWFYEQGAKALDPDDVVPQGYFIAQEDSPPYCTAVYRYLETAMEVAGAQMRRTMDEYAACVASGVYPGYSEEIADIDLPRYAYAREVDGE